MEDFLTQWNHFLEQDYASVVLMIVGGLLILFGIMKILGSSLKLLMWVLLVGIGAFSFNYGWERTATGAEVSLSDELKELIGPGKTLTLEAMKRMCMSMGQGGEQTGDSGFGQSE